MHTRFDNFFTGYITQSNTLICTCILTFELLRIPSKTTFFVILLSNTRQFHWSKELSSLQRLLCCWGRRRVSGGVQGIDGKRERKASLLLFLSSFSSLLSFPCVVENLCSCSMFSFACIYQITNKALCCSGSCRPYSIQVWKCKVFTA